MNDKPEAGFPMLAYGSSIVVTDHEMLDNVGLIHMNGRVYDPGLGRFLSVDPVFQFPENTQSLNPYSYVLNTPLTMTDPTGLMGSCTGEDFDMPCGGFGSNGGLMQDPGGNYNCDSCSAPGTGGGRSKTSAITIAGGTVMSRENGGSVAIDGNTLADFGAGEDPSAILEIASLANGQVASATLAGPATTESIANVTPSEMDFESKPLSAAEKTRRIETVRKLVTVQKLAGTGVTERQIESYRLYVDEFALSELGWKLIVDSTTESVTISLSNRGTTGIAVGSTDIQINVNGQGFSQAAGGAWIENKGFRAVAHELGGHLLSRNLSTKYDDTAYPDQAAMRRADGGPIGIENRITAQRWAMKHGTDVAKQLVGVRISHDGRPDSSGLRVEK